MRTGNKHWVLTNPASVTGRIKAIAMRRAAFGLLGFLVTPAVADEPGSWPGMVRSQPVRVVSVKAPEEVAHAYETSCFLLLSDDRIDLRQLEKFAKVIESVPRVLKAFPLPLWAPPPEDKFRVMLCRDAKNYEELGGPLGSTGVYNGRERKVIIRGDVFLRPASAQPTRLQPKPDENLLVHELTHLGMHDLLWRVPPWFSEGFAEYMAAGHLGGGAYEFSRIDSAIRDRIRRHLPEANGAVIELPSLQSLIATTSDEWIEGNKNPDVNSVYLPYAASLLLIHYHLHGKDRIKALDEYLAAVRAWRDPRLPPPSLKPGPLGGVEELIGKYWKPRGLAIKFGNAGDSTDGGLKAP